MLKQLAKSIVNYYKNDVMSNTFSKIYFSEAPPNAIYPYIIYTFPAVKDDWTFTERFFEFMVQFDIYTDNSSAGIISSLVALVKGDERLKTGFDFAEFTVDDNLMLGFEPMTMVPHKFFRENKQIFACTLTYTCLLERV